MTTPPKGSKWIFSEYEYGRVSQLTRESDSGILARIVDHSLFGMAFFVYQQALIPGPSARGVRAVSARACYNFAEAMEIIEGMLDGKSRTSNAQSP